MIASDIVICKGTFMTTWELAYLGVPSISVPDLDNPVDQVRVNKMNEYNITERIDPRELNKTLLLEKVKKLLNLEEKRRMMSKAAEELVNGRGQREAAEEINYFICSTLKRKQVKK
jgi:UDP-N-acetylglucosamine:LPS N-acetylglucosamine transferase